MTDTSGKDYAFDAWDFDYPKDSGEDTYLVELGKPCPKCGVAVSALAGNDVGRRGQEQMAEYDIELPDTWTDGLNDPALLFCDCPACRYVGATEWGSIAEYMNENVNGPNDQEAPYWESMGRAGREHHMKKHHPNVEVQWEDDEQN